MRWLNHLRLQVMIHPLMTTIMTPCLPWFMIPSISLKFLILLTLLSFFLQTSPPSTRTPNTAKVHGQFFSRAKKSATKLIYRGTNGGLPRCDMCVLQETACKINSVGINNHELTGLPIVTAFVVPQTNWGPVVVLLCHEYAHLGKGSPIHASGQLEWFHSRVDEHKKIVDGQQHLVTLEGHTIHISINSGLAHIHPVSIPSDHDLRHSHMWFLLLLKNGTQLSSTTGLSWNYFQILTPLLKNPSFKSPLLMSLVS